MPKVTIPSQTKFHLLPCPAVSHKNGQSKPKSTQQEKSLFLLFLLQSRFMHCSPCHLFFQCLIFGRCKFRVFNYSIFLLKTCPHFTSDSQHCYLSPTQTPRECLLPSDHFSTSSSSKASANQIQSYTMLFLCLQNKCFS